MLLLCLCFPSIIELNFFCFYIAESGVTLDRGGSDDTYGTPRSREQRSSDVSV